MYKWWDHKSRFNTFHHFPTEKNPFVLERKCSFFRFRRSRPSLAISLYLSLTLKPHQRLRSFAFKANKRGCRWLGENIPVFTFLVSHHCCGFAWICYWIDLRRPADSWRKRFYHRLSDIKRSRGKREGSCLFCRTVFLLDFVHSWFVRSWRGRKSVQRRESAKMTFQIVGSDSLETCCVLVFLATLSKLIFLQIYGKIYQKAWSCSFYH